MKDAKQHLAELASGDLMIFADPLIRFPVKARLKDKTSPEAEEVFNIFRPLLTMHPGMFVTAGDGKFSYCQPVTLRDPQSAITNLNKIITRNIAKDVKNIAPPAMDEETVHVFKKAFEDGHVWMRLEKGQLSFTIPGTRPFFTRMRRDFFRPSDLDNIRHDLTNLADHEGKPKEILARLQRDVSTLQGILEGLTETPWSIDQKHNQLTVAIGWGNGDPFRLGMPVRRPYEKGRNAEKELLTYAKTLEVPVRDNIALEDVMAAFEKTGKLPKK